MKKRLFVAVVMLCSVVLSFAQNNKKLSRQDDFYSGLAVVRDNNTHKYGFMNEAGKLVIPCKWSGAGNFDNCVEGLAMVMNAKKLWGFIDKTGKLVVPCEWEEVGHYISDFLGGIISVMDENGLWGCVDMTGKVVIPCQYKDISTDMEDGRLRVKNNNDEWLYIDQTGQEFTPSDR